MSTVGSPTAPATQPAGAAAEVEGARNVERFRRLVEEGFNRGNLAVVDELIAPGQKEHQYVGPNHPDGPEGVKILITSLRRLFPNFRLTMQAVVADGDTVWARMIGEGTHAGEFLGRPPTGRDVAVPVIDICRFVDGKIVEHWGVPDRFYMMVQLGMLPTPVGAPT